MNHIFKSGLASVLMLIATSSVAEATRTEKACVDHKKYDASIAACDKIVASKKYSKKRKAIALVNKCVTYSKRKQYDAMVSACKKAIEFDPAIQWANHNIALVHGERGDKENAIKFYKRELHVNPNNVSALNDLCYHLRHVEKDVEATSHCHKARQLKPKNIWPYYNLAFAYKNLGYFKPSIKHLSKFRELTLAKDKNDPNASVAANEIAVSETKILNFKEDRKTAASTAKSDHGDWLTCLNGSAEASAQQVIEACETIVRRPKWIKHEDGGWSGTGRITEILVARAEARAKLKQHELALLDYNHVLALNPKLSDVLIARSRSFEAMGKRRSATKDVKAALLLIPSSDSRHSEQKQQLKKLELKIKAAKKATRKKRAASARKKAKRVRKAKARKKSRKLKRKRTSGRLRNYADAYAYCRKRYGRTNVQTVRKRNGKYICHLHAYSPNE